MDIVIYLEIGICDLEFFMQGTGGFLNPQKILSELAINAPAVVADFGCGHGYFSLPLAGLVGEQGKVYALDVLTDALDEVKSKAQQLNLKNIETIRGNLEIAGGSKLPDNSCDAVLLTNILFQSQKKADIIKEAGRVLKSGGSLVIIDWQPNGQSLTADSGWRISQNEAQALAQAENFSFQRQFDAGQYHWGMIFRKT